jgi:hypothetical protein
LRCAGESEPEDSGELSWIVAPEGGEPSTLDLEATSAPLALVFGQLPHLNGAPMFEVYDVAMSFADEHCPRVDSASEGGSLWDERCTSDAGASYSGFISLYRGMHGTNYEQQMRGEATVSLPDGRTFVIAGQANTAESSEGREFSSAVTGVFSWTGAVSEGAILVEGWETSLSWSAAYSGEGQLLRFSANGNVALPAGPLTAVAFDDVKFNADRALACTLEPTGELALRDEQGTWHSLVFDVTMESDGTLSVPDGLCDGCGTVWDNGEEAGTVCVDVSPLFAAPFPPW